MTVVVCALVLVLAVISIALRIYTRVFTCQGLGPDDWLILVAVVMMLPTAMLLILGKLGCSDLVRDGYHNTFRLNIRPVHLLTCFTE